MKGLMNQFGDGVHGFEAEKELPFKPVTNSENTQLIEETEDSQKSSETGMDEETEEIQKSSKTGLEVVPVSCLLSFDIDSQVKSMMKKSKTRVKSTKYTCKTCGKEGFSSSIKNHIERSHLEGFVVLCDQCENTYTTRNGLRRHKRTHS